MPDATDLAATLRRLIGHHQIHLPARIEPDRSGVNDLYDVMMADDEAFACTCEDYEAAFIEFAANNASAIAAALERGAAASSYRSEAGDSFDRLAMALMESIERGEDQLIQLERIGNACNDVDDWDDESRALWVRAKAAAAKNAADLERGAAAEALVALGRQLNAPLRLVPDAGQLMRDYDAALAAYRALTEGETTDG